MQEKPFNLEYSYLNLPIIFYSKEKPSVFTNASFLLWNEKLCENLDFSSNDSKEFIKKLTQNQYSNADFFSQAYAGHQFGKTVRSRQGRRCAYFSNNCHQQ